MPQWGCPMVPLTQASAPCWGHLGTPREGQAPPHPLCCAVLGRPQLVKACAPKPELSPLYQAWFCPILSGTPAPLCPRSLLLSLLSPWEAFQGLPFSSPGSRHPLCSQSSHYWLQQQQSQPYMSGVILSLLHICNTYSAQEPRRQGLWDELFYKTRV